MEIARPLSSATRLFFIHGLIAFSASLMATASLQAQIVIGQTAGFSGTVAASVKEITEGAKLFLNSVNARGGVNGQKIELVSLDDKFEVPLAVSNARKLIQDKGAIALLLNRGTPHTEAVIAVLDEFGVPLIGPSTGALSLHDPVRKNVFNVRATYQREAEKLVSMLSVMGIKTFGVIHVEDSFGADALIGLRKGLAEAKITPVFLEKFDRSQPDFTKFGERVKNSDAHAIVAIGSGSTVAEIAKVMRTQGSTARLVTLSNNASSGFIQSLGENAQGTFVMQVFPNERSISTPMVREALALAKTAGLSTVSPATLEGFAAAKVLVEGLRRAGPKPTSEKLRSALETLRPFDLGGLTISYSPTDHSGIDFVDLSVVSRDGKFIR